MNKLHPLHTPEMVAQHLTQTGYYLGDRRTGKTTAACLAAIAKAIKTPGKFFVIEDPDSDTPGLRNYIESRARNLADVMGLQHLHIEVWVLGGNQRVTVIMERRP